MSANEKTVAPEIVAAIRRYMAESMAMPYVESDQESNWTFGHIVALAGQLLASAHQRAEQAERENATLRRLAKESTNGWACYARTRLEHKEIARLHRGIDSVSMARHDWTTRRLGGDPAEASSAERVRFCKSCGKEQTDDNEDEACL